MKHLEIKFAAVLLGREIWKSNSQPCCWAVRCGNQIRSRVAILAEMEAKPEARNPKPETRNPKPETLNPKP